MLPGTALLLSQRESFASEKFFDSQISMIFDISDLPESKYVSSRKSLSLCVCVCVRARVCVCVMNLSAA